MVFVSNPFEPVTSFQQPKEVTKKGRSLLKFLTAQKGLNLKCGKSSGGATKGDIDKIDSITIEDFVIISTNLSPQALPPQVSSALFGLLFYWRRARRSIRPPNIIKSHELGSATEVLLGIASSHTNWPKSASSAVLIIPRMFALNWRDGKFVIKAAGTRLCIEKLSNQKSAPAETATLAYALELSGLKPVFGPVIDTPDCKGDNGVPPKPLNVSMGSLLKYCPAVVVLVPASAPKVSCPSCAKLAWNRIPVGA